MGTFLQIVTRVGGIGAGAIAWPALALSAVMVMASIPSANAQQTTGTPGSPSATTTIPGNQLPAPPPKFGGVINESATQSKPYWPPRLVPPKGAPNVLLIMTDDQGYGVSSTFGGVIPTPTLDRIAANGLRYTQMGLAFHGEEPSRLGGAIESLEAKATTDAGCRPVSRRHVRVRERSNENNQTHLVRWAGFPCCRDGGGHGGVRATAVRRSDRKAGPSGWWSACEFDRNSLGSKRRAT